MSLQELETEGQQAQLESLTRFGIKPKKQLFRQEMHQSAAYEAWGSFFQGELGAYLVTHRVEDWVYIQIQRSVHQYLKYRPNNALIFTVLNELLSRPGINAVSYGWEPLYDLDSLAAFKENMGSVKEPCRQRVVLAPRFRAALRPFVCRTVEGLSSLHSKNARLKRLAGVCRLIREST